jgi:WXG100 family type VII secretion target
MSDIYAHFPSMLQAFDDIQASAGAIDTQLTDLGIYLDQLQPHWDSQSQDAYAAQRQQWQTSATDLNLWLGKLATALSDATDAYQLGEAQLIRIWEG